MKLALSGLVLSNSALFQKLLNDSSEVAIVTHYYMNFYGKVCMQNGSKQLNQWLQRYGMITKGSRTLLHYILILVKKWDQTHTGKFIPKVNW